MFFEALVKRPMSFHQGAKPFFPARIPRRFLLVKLPALLLALALLPLHDARAGAVIREEGAIYLEDLLPRPVRLVTTADAPIYYKIDMERYLGVLKKGQPVELQAIADGTYRVRGKAQQGQVAGWVQPRFLTPLRTDFVQSVRENAARRDEVEALILKNEVAVNMTPEEVQRALGKPAKKTSHIDGAGREEVWEFVRYERIPQEVIGRDRFGQLVKTVQYIKIPAGKLAITFSRNLVTSLEQTEGTIEGAARVKIVASPFTVVY